MPATAVKRRAVSNILCPFCGGPIAVDRGLRHRGAVYCSRPCLETAGRERPDGRRVVRDRSPDLSLPETRRS
jgi:hypothetical protein